MEDFMIQRMISTLIVSAALIVGYTSTAFAEGWTSAQTIKEIQIGNYNDQIDGTEQLFLRTSESSWGAGCYSSEARREATDPLEDKLLSVALAAYLSGKKVKAYISVWGSTCYVLRLRLVSE